MSQRGRRCGWWGRWGRWGWWIATAAAVGAIGVRAASAQQPLDPLTLQPVIQGQEDVGPLSRSLGMESLDLRHPAGFERVYVAPDGRLMRISGGTVAVFPRSVYTPARGGYVPEIPPGTIFYIGGPPEVEQQPFEPSDGALSRPAAAPLAGRIDRSVNQLPAARDEQSAARARPIGGGWEDERYRQRRIAELLDRALRAGG